MLPLVGDHLAGGEGAAVEPRDEFKHLLRSVRPPFNDIKARTLGKEGEKADHQQHWGSRQTHIPVPVQSGHAHQECRQSRSHHGAQGPPDVHKCGRHRSNSLRQELDVVGGHLRHAGGAQSNSETAEENPGIAGNPVVSGAELQRTEHTKRNHDTLHAKDGLLATEGVSKQSPEGAPDQGAAEDHGGDDGFFGVCEAPVTPDQEAEGGEDHHLHGVSQKDAGAESSEQHLEEPTAKLLHCLS